MNRVRGDTTQAVNDFMARLEHPLKPEIEAVRGIILRADPRITESIKWNAPSFALTEHFATFKLRPVETVQIVLHTGAKARPTGKGRDIDDPTRLLHWAAKDRCVATFSDMQDIVAKAVAFGAIVKQWVEQV